MTLLMVMVGAFNAVARYLGKWIGVHLSSNAYIEAQWYLFSLIFLLGAAHTLQRDQHVRVDVLYGRLSDTGKAWIDLLGGLLFFDSLQRVWSGDLLASRAKLMGCL